MVDEDGRSFDVTRGEDRVSPRIYSLARQVTGFHRACEPLEGMLGQVARAERVRDDETLRHLLRDVSDHAVSVTRRVEALRAALNDAMQLDATLTPGEWGRRARALVARFFRASDDDDRMMLNQLDEALQCWSSSDNQASRITARGTGSSTW